MSNEKMATITFRLSEEEKTKLAIYCAEHDIPMSQAVREAVRQYLNKV